MNRIGDTTLNLGVFVIDNLRSNPGEIFMICGNPNSSWITCMNKDCNTKIFMNTELIVIRPTLSQWCEFVRVYQWLQTISEAPTCP